MLQLAIASVKSGFRKLFVVSGRASRAEYWWAHLVFLFLLGLVPRLAFKWLENLNFTGTSGFLIIGYLIFFMTVFLAIMLVLMVVFMTGLNARRLHDINRSGWWQLLFLTGIGYFFLVYWWSKKGDVGDNRFGPEPTIKEAKTADWLVPLILYFSPYVLNGLGGFEAERSAFKDLNAIKSGAPVAASAPAVSAPASSVGIMDACEQRMADHAIANKADPKAYIASNQPYLAECRKTLSPAQPQQ